MSNNHLLQLTEEQLQKKNQYMKEEGKKKRTQHSRTVSNVNSRALLKRSKAIGNHRRKPNRSRTLMTGLGFAGLGLRQLPVHEL
jgi:hypothetical protein